MQTDSLFQTALAFAREIMGYKDVALHDISDDKSVVWAEDEPVFDYTGLSSVMDAAAKWCERANEDYGLSLHLTRRGKWVANILDEAYSPSELISGDFADYENPCQAIMQACLGANRKMKEKAA